MLEYQIPKTDFLSRSLYDNRIWSGGRRIFNNAVSPEVSDGSLLPHATRPRIKDK